MQISQAKGTVIIASDWSRRSISTGSCLLAVEVYAVARRGGNPARPRDRTTGQRPCTIHCNGPDKRQLERLREVVCG
jgi:hypothetical protein